MENRSRLVLLVAVLAAALFCATFLLEEDTYDRLPVAPSSGDVRAGTAGDGTVASPVALVEPSRAPVLESLERTEPASEEPTPERVDPRRIEAAAALLRHAFPDRYGDLTPEEALAIEALDLHGAEITDAGMFHLSGLNLASLELRGTSLTGVALHQLPSAGLERLHLTDTLVTGNDLALLPPMANLQVLKLNRLEVDDAHLDRLASYPLLQHVELDGTGITDFGLRKLLQRNPNVSRIELRGTEISEEAARELGSEYPNCELVLENQTQIVFGRR